MSGSLTRRGVLTGAAAIAGMTALPRFLNARVAIGHVVVDERLAQSAQFARGVAATRMHAVGALNDLCNRWYTRLRAQVLADAGPIAGLTTWMDYVVMRSCAAEIGYAGAFHAEHVPVGAAGLAHAVTAHPDLLASLVRLAQPQTGRRRWGRRWLPARICARASCPEKYSAPPRLPRPAMCAWSRGCFRRYRV